MTTAPPLLPSQLVTLAVETLVPMIVRPELRERIFGAFIEDGNRCNVERIPRALLFLYLTEFDSEEYSRALHRLLPVLVIKSARDENDDKVKLVKQQFKHDLKNMDEVKDKGYRYWHLLVFALLKQSNADLGVYNPTRFIADGGLDDDESFPYHNEDQLKNRTKVLSSDMVQSRGTVERRVDEFTRRKERVAMGMSILHSMLAKSSTTASDIGSAWRMIKPLHALFSRHASITQPVLLGAMIYSKMTCDGIQGSKQLERSNSALWDLFYQLMACAQVDDSMNGKKRGVSESYFGDEEDAEATEDEIDDEDDITRMNLDDSDQLEVPDDLLLMLSSGGLSSQAKECSPQRLLWITDSVPVSVCCHRAFFTEMQPLSKRALFKVEGGEQMRVCDGPEQFHRVEGIGKIAVTVRNQLTNKFVKMTVDNVRYVPSLPMNVLAFKSMGARVAYGEGVVNLNFDDPSDQRCKLVSSGDANEDIKPQGMKLKSLIPQRYCFLDFNSKPDDFGQQIELAPTPSQVAGLRMYKECVFDSASNGLYRYNNESE